MTDDLDLPAEIIELYAATRRLPDGRIIGVHRLLFHWTLHIDIDWAGYADRYCYRHLMDVMIGFTQWDGVGDPPGLWHKHPDSGRCRLEGNPLYEYQDWDYVGECEVRRRLAAAISEKAA